MVPVSLMPSQWVRVCWECLEKIAQHTVFTTGRHGLHQVASTSTWSVGWTGVHSVSEQCSSSHPRLGVAWDSGLRCRYLECKKYHAFADIRRSGSPPNSRHTSIISHHAGSLEVRHLVCSTTCVSQLSPCVNNSCSNE